MIDKLTSFNRLSGMICIAIVSILALFVIAKISQFQVYTRIVKLRALRANVITSAAVIHGRLLAHQGKPDRKVCVDGIANNNMGAESTFCIEGKGIIRLVYGYPAVTEVSEKGILAVTGLTELLDATATQLHTQGYDYAKVGNVAVFQVTGGRNANSCAFIYIEATVNAKPMISTVVETGC